MAYLRGLVNTHQHCLKLYRLVNARGGSLVVTDAINEMIDLVCEEVALEITLDRLFDQFFAVCTVKLEGLVGDTCLFACKLGRVVERAVEGPSRFENQLCTVFKAEYTACRVLV